MLSEEKISAIAILLSIAGLALLAFFSNSETPVPLKIAGLEGFEGKASVNARISGSYFSGNTLFLTLFDGNSIKAVYFNPPESALEASAKNSVVVAEGFVEESAGGRVFKISRIVKHA